MATCKEGDWIAVQLEERGWVLGLIARGAKQVPYHFAYFFPPRREAKPTMQDTLMLGYPDALMLCVCNINKFELVGSTEGWNRNLWPMPKFVRREGTGLVAITRDPNDPGNVASREALTEAQAKELQRDQICDDKTLPLRLELHLVSFENAADSAKPLPPLPLLPPPPALPTPPAPPESFAPPEARRDSGYEVAEPAALAPLPPPPPPPIVTAASPASAPADVIEMFAPPEILEASPAGDRFLDPERASPQALRAGLGRQALWVRETQGQTLVMSGEFFRGKTRYHKVLDLSGTGWTDAQVYEVLRACSQAAARGHAEGGENMAAEIRQLLGNRTP